MGKDFTGITAGKVKTTIAEATQEAPAAQEEQQKRKDRKTYNAQETAEFLQDMKTAGRKGIKLPRINLAFSPDVYDYIKTMSKAAGLSYTEFVNIVLQEHKDSHTDTYKQALEIRNSL